MISTDDSTTLSIRASRSDTAWECAESVVLDPEAIRINQPHELTELGSAFHEWAQSIESDERSDPTVIAQRYGVEADELDMLCAFAMIAERDISKWFTGSDTEIKHSHICAFDCPPYTHLRLSGSIDRRKIVDKKIHRHLDYKTGYLDGGYDHQQRCYAFLAVANDPEIESIYSAVSYVRLGWWEAKTYTREELLAWFEDFMLRLRNGLGSFNPADHCGRCDRMHGCPGAKAYTQNSLAILSNGAVQVELTAENKTTIGPLVAQTLRDVRFIEKRCAEFRAVLKLQIQKVGPVPSGIDGKVLGIVKANKRSLDAQKAWPILSKRMTRDEINSACSVSLGKCQNAIAAKVETGKGKARTAIAEELQAAGAIKTAVTESLKETKDKSNG